MWSKIPLQKGLLLGNSARNTISFSDLYLQKKFERQIFTGLLITFITQSSRAQFLIPLCYVPALTSESDPT